jgi:hypothetical protein
MHRLLQQVIDLNHLKVQIQQHLPRRTSTPLPTLAVLVFVSVLSVVSVLAVVSLFDTTNKRNHIAGSRQDINNHPQPPLHRQDNLARNTVG